jgi:RimJ/RimL family protein N-acetyltransferase
MGFCIPQVVSAPVAVGEDEPIASAAGAPGYAYAGKGSNLVMANLLETERLLLRNWDEPDRELFAYLLGDPAVTRYLLPCGEPAEVRARFDRMRDQIRESGYGFYVLVHKATGRSIGWCGLYQAQLEPCLPAGTIEVGWRLHRDHWGRGYAAEAARACLREGFLGRGLEEIVAFTVAANHRSRAVMERIGMHRDPGGDFEHPRVPPERPDLKAHVLYRLTRGEWRAHPGGC